MAFTSNVLNGVIVTSETVISGTQNIKSGGIANSTTINSYGGQAVSSGGIANSTIINDYGNQTVYSGGTANYTTINSQFYGYGDQYVSSGGTANYTTVNGGAQDISSGGVANFTTVNSSGGLNVSSGGTANNTTVNFGGYHTVAGTTNSTTVSSGGIQTVLDSGVANSTTVNGVQDVLSGGVANSTTVNSAGIQNVTSGGVANFTTVNSSGSMMVDYGGSAISVNVASGGRLGWDFNTVLSGTSNGMTLNNNNGKISYNFVCIDEQNVSSGYVANFATFEGWSQAKSIQTVYNGGVANNTILNNYSQQYVSSGGVANNTTISGVYWYAKGFQEVMDGGVANNTTIIANGGQNIYVGGIVNSTTVNSGGYQDISVGGVANNTTVNDGGGQYVEGVANSTAVNGVQDVLGVANSTTVTAGSQNVFSGGVANYTTISGFDWAGSQNVFSGGVANYTTINSAGIQNISSGGVANFTTVNFGGSQSVLGVANNTTVNDGGMIDVGIGCSASGLTVLSGGFLRCDFGAFLNGTINGIAVADSIGRTSYNGVYDEQAVSSGYVANYTKIDGGGTGQTIYNGGVANFTTISGYANYARSFQTIYNGGVANFTNIDERSTQNISSGGVANSTTIQGGYYATGIQEILDGGVANSTFMNEYGLQNVSSGGVANFTTIQGYDCQQYVFSGGMANNTIINYGDQGGGGIGTQYVEDGGVANNTIVNDGCMYVSSRGIISGTLTIAGGYVSLDDAVSASGLKMVSYILATAATDNWLLEVDSGTLGTGKTAYSLNLNNTAKGCYILAKGVDLSGMKNKTFSVTDNSQTVNVTVGSSYTFADGDKLSLNLTDAATDQLTAIFTVAPVVLPKITIAATDAAAAEPANDGTFRITRTGATTSALTVNFSTGGTATSGSDYVLKNGITALTNSVVIAAGQSYVDVTLDVIDDAIAESSETAIMNLTANAAYTLGVATSGTINISDNELPDKLPPSVPAGLTVKLDGRTLVLDWADSADKSGIKQYEVRADEQPDFSSKFVRDIPVSESKFTKTDMEVGTFYAKVRAQDNAGNWSAWSKSASVTVVGTLAVNDSVDDWVGSTDVYKLNLATAGTLNLYLEGLSGDVNLALFDAKSKQLKISSAKGSTPESITNTVLAKGDYFVKVIPAAKTTNTDYTLRNTFVALPADAAVNTWQEAKLAPKDISGGVDNWVGFGDAADCYRLVMTNAGTLTLGLTGLTGDANLSLLDGTGKVLKTSANKGLTGEAISMDLLTGTYYVNVAPVTGVNNATYTLTHAEKYCPVDTAVNTWQEAKLAPKDISGGVDNWVGFGDTADCYRLVMSKNGKLTLGLKDLTGDANLSLLDSKGKVLKTSANKLNAPEAITTDLLAGTYYVNVAPVKGVNKAAYTLTHVKTDFQDDTAGDSFVKALKVTTSGTVNESLGFSDKDDYYKFELKTAATATFNLNGISSGSNVDLYLYDSNFKQIAVSKKTGNAAESITKALAADTAYYVKATLAAKSASTSYALNFNIDPAAFKSGSLQLFSASSPLTSSSDSALSADPLKKNQGMLAS